MVRRLGLPGGAAGRHATQPGACMRVIGATRVGGSEAEGIGPTGRVAGVDRAMGRVLVDFMCDGYV